MANGTNGNGETRKTVAQLAKEVVAQKTSIEVLRNEVKSVANVNEKLDNTIDKLTDISSSMPHWHVMAQALFWPAFYQPY